MNQTKDIFLGYRQLTFGFDQLDEKDGEKLLLFIGKKINNCEAVTMGDVVGCFSEQPYAWSLRRILLLVENLLLDIKIQFLRDGLKLTPENMRSYLSDPDQFENIEIVKPEIVDKGTLTEAQRICGKLFAGHCDKDQNSQCRFIRKRFRNWKNSLNSFKRLADTGRYPGKNEIKSILALIEEFQAHYDPKAFIEFFIQKKDSLHNAFDQMAVLKSFYTDDIHVWNNLMEAVDAFKKDRQILEKDRQAKKALQQLIDLSESPEPYKRMVKIPELLSTVTPLHKKIIQERTDSRRIAVINDLKKKIEHIKSILNEKQANRDLRNRTLLPFQSLMRKISNAKHITLIDQFYDDASDAFDMALMMLE